MTQIRGQKIGIVLLIVQPVLFFFRVLFAPQQHIPYDIAGFHLPLAAYIARCVRERVLPLWAPDPYLGVPIHADITAQLFYPPTWISLLLGNLSHGHKLYYWLEWQIPLHMILAGLFTFWLLRYLGIGAVPAFFGASVYQLGGFFASQAQHLGAVGCAAWLPLILLCVWKLSREVTRKWIAALAVSLTMSILAGFTAASFVVFVITGIVIVALAVSAKWKIKFLFSVACGFLFGIAMSAVQLIPTYELSGLSVASDRPQALGTGGGLRIQSLASLIWPNYYHIFTPFDPSFKLQINFTFLYVYCGIITLLLVIAAPMLRRAAHARLFFILTIVSAIWMLGDETPVYRFVFTHLPRIVRAALYAEEALLAFCLFAGLAAAVALNHIGRNWPLKATWALAILSSADLIYFGANRPMNSQPGSYAETSEYKLDGDPALLEHLQTLVDETSPPMRIDYLDDFPAIGSATMFKLPTPAGDSAFALKRVLAVRRLFCKGFWWERRILVDRPRSPILNMLSVGILGVRSNLEWASKIDLPFEFEATGMRVYRNPTAMPRFFLVRHVQLAGSAQEALDRLSLPTFEPAREAIVEASNLGLDEPLSTGEVRVEKYSPNEIQLNVSTGGRAFLASSEVMYPGWSATVNGKPAPLYMTNGAFRGIVLGPGTNQIAMRYRPKSLFAGAMISALSAGLLLLGTLYRYR